MTQEILQDNQLNFAEQTFAASGPDFWDKERELKYCWTKVSRDWGRFMRDETFTHQWDFREIEHRQK